MAEEKSSGEAKAVESSSHHGSGRCLFCLGSGKVSTRNGEEKPSPCPRCNGSGNGPRMVTK